MRACCAMLLLMPLTLCASVPKADVRGQRAEVSGQRAEVRGQRAEVSKSVSPAAAVVTPAPDPTAAPAASSWHPTPLARYEGILSRMPFGLAPPAAPAPANATPATPPPPAFVNKLVLCAINRTPSGNVAVGFVDGNVTPPRSYYMDVGETQDGFTAVSADIEQECATIDKDGTSVTLWLPGATKRSASIAIAVANNAILTAATAMEKRPPAPEVLVKGPPPKQAFTNAMEQLLSMELSVPLGVTPPPLPIPEGGLHDDHTHKALASVIVIETNDTDAVATHKESVGWAKEEMRSYLKDGGTAVSYLQTLRVRRAAEFARQKAARDAAETQIRELAKTLSKSEVEKQLEAINKSLTDAGGDPITAPDPNE